MRSQGLRTLLLGGLLALLSSGSAQALMFQNLGDIDSTSFLISDPALMGIDLTATLSGEVVAIEADGDLVVKFTVENTTDNTGFEANRIDITAIGFDLDPEEVAVSLVASDPDAFDGFENVINTNFPGGFTVDLCVFSGPTCEGAGNDGVGPGEMDMFTLRFDTDEKITLDPFSKWQTDFGSFEAPAVPEPATAVLLGLGMAGLAGIRRRESR